MDSLRDPAITEMVEYFDRLAGKHHDWDSMSFEERYSTLKKAERDAITDQCSRCIEDFSYASRNYFWITNKSGKDQLFTLWESQWLILQKYYELKRKGKAQKIMVLKARQLGCSLLVEAMIAWRTMFFPNTEALVVSVDQDHAKYLFSLMLHVYDMMPWWLKPQAAALKYEEGLHFDNPNRDERRLRPGLNSHIYVQHSTQTSGVGQGRRISACHVSEYTDFLQKRAEEIIEADLLHAIADDPSAFAFLESTGRGSGTYSHNLWKANVTRGELAEWTPLFLPFFFERSRFTAPPNGWHPMKQEAALRDRVKREWVRCDLCSQYQVAAVHGVSIANTICPACEQGTLHNVHLEDGQLYWKENKRLNAELKGSDSLKKHMAEMATTAEQAWQLSGVCVFDDDCLEKANVCVIDPMKCADVKRGYLDRRGKFHGLRGEKGCWNQDCREDHRFDEEVFTIWEEPKKGYEYSVGVDISEGIGQDYSVISVIKLTKWGDEEVACWRSNAVDPGDLPFYVDTIGRMYNEALMCIEYQTGFRIVGNDVRYKYLYPNLFQWKHLDSKIPLSNKVHWLTQYNTKPLLWQTLRKRIKAGVFLPRSPNVIEEMKTFQKDEEDERMAKHERGAHDDHLMALMIALYCAHELEADETGRIPLPENDSEDLTGRYMMKCLKCKNEWRCDNPSSQYRCPKEDCMSIRITGSLIDPVTETKRGSIDFNLLDQRVTPTSNPTLDVL